MAEELIKRLKWVQGWHGDCVVKMTPNTAHEVMDQTEQGDLASARLLGLPIRLSTSMPDNMIVIEDAHRGDFLGVLRVDE